VKPGNILLDASGTAYITDFGLAKDTEGTVLTKPGQALGSLDYMAPEQIRGEQVGPAADVYALGCVLCECLAGAPPFADRQGMRVLWAHLQDTPESPCAKRADVPPKVGEAVLRGLAKEPAERPQSASEYARLVRSAAVA
jgi:serine/threonine-protein kinase